MEIKELKNALWAAAKKVGTNLDTKRYIVSGLFFLKYVTDPSNNTLTENLKNSGNSIITENNGNNQPYFSHEFLVPEKAQWLFLQSNAAHADIGILLDDAVAAIEKLNKNLTGIFPKNYSDPAVDKLVLGELIRLIGSIDPADHGSKHKELLAEMFEYLLLMFAESKGANQYLFYTPQSIVKLLVQIIAPRNGKIYDGCCGTGDMFVQSQKFIKKRSNINELHAYGQENNPITLKIAKMNLALHNISTDLCSDDVFTNDCFPGFVADYILANSSYSVKDRNINSLQDDKRWKYGLPPAENADYAWLQHFVSKLSPTGTAGIILDKSSAERNHGEEGKIRKNLIEAKLIDCMITLPSKIFNSAKADACIWILTGNKTNNTYKNAGSQILFINAQKMGAAVNRRNKELTDEDIAVITRTYQRWKNINGDYIDIKGFCKSVSIEEVRKNKYSLLPEKYVSSRSLKVILPALLLIILLAGIYLTGEKNGLFTASKPKKQDTAITVRPQILKNNTLPEKKLNKTVKKEAGKQKTEGKETAAGANNHPVKANDSTVEVKKYSAILPTKTVEKPPVTKAPLPVGKSENGIIKYKVNSTAYFYNKADESTRRNAFITHWNNSYANIQALDEKNDFIYVVFTNHLHQTSKGWLRKADLKEIRQ